MLTLANSLLLPLLLTILIEVIVAILLGYKKRDEILLVILANIITNPALNYLLILNNYLRVFKYSALVILLEILVVLIEWQILYFALKKPRSKLFILSLAMNTASFLLGLLIFHNYL